MANQRLKNKLIDAFNAALEEESSKKIANEYSKVINDIQDAILKELESKGTLTIQSLRAILNQFPLTSAVFTNSIIASYIGSSVGILIENPNLTGKDLKRLAPVIELIRTTSIKRPVILAKRVVLFSEMISTGRDNLPVRFQGAFVSLKEFVGETNAKQITKIAREFNTEISKLNEKIKTRLSRDMLTDLRKFQKSQTIFDEDGKRLKAPRPLTQREISNRMNTKYGTSKTRVDRIIRTEVHAQNELVRQLDAKQRGFDKKRWINEGDSRVRSSHKGQILQQRPAVSEKFVLRNRKTGKVSLADYPGDVSLPTEERINCRCTVAYTKK